MAIDVSAHIEIARPVDQVAAFATEAENDPRWIGGISEVRRLTPGPTQVGTRVERIARFMGKEIEYVMEVAELVRGRRIVLRSIKSPFPMTVTYSFDDDLAERTPAFACRGSRTASTRWQDDS